VYIVTADQMKALDSRTVREVGIPGAVLMENAGRGTVEAMLYCFPDQKNGPIHVLCGRGNNGGDGFVIARYFLNLGAEVMVYLLTSADRVQGDAGINLEAYRKMGGTILEIEDETAFNGIKDELGRASIIVDALLGTGLSSEVKGLYRAVIDQLNSFKNIPIVSVDVPSGLDATTGKILGSAVKAALTCTYGLPKIGHFTYPGRENTGELEVIDIGIPESLIKASGIKRFLLEEDDFMGIIPARKPDSHKGIYGHVLVLAGSPGKTGAASLAGHAAMRAGAGLVTLGVPNSLRSVVEEKTKEVMTESLPDGNEGYLGMDAWPKLAEMLESKNAVAVGPGLSDRAETGELVLKLIEEADVPLVIDADGLNLVAKNKEVLKKAKLTPVLTPHPGEMSRLTNLSVKEIQADRINIASSFAKEYKVILVLKGASTVIAEPTGKIFINTTGNPGMAGGGMGDVLTGFIASLIGQGIASLDAARMAVFTHGAIGDFVAENRAETGILASDITEKIPEFLNPYIKKD
jgi:hydroxyethylthiazole kinase-like uncharacterized protein yjeF